MVRVVSALFVFAVILCGYIVTRPGTPRLEMPDQTPQVARAETSDAASLVPIPSKRPIRTDNTDIESVIDDVLSNLGLQNRAPDPMRDQTESILGEISSATGLGRAKLKTSSSEDLSGIITQALKSGATDGAINQIVNQSALDGTITIPTALMTTDHKVDTHVLLSQIVTQARIVTGQDIAQLRAPEGNSYVVQDGDSLGGIAHRLYGDANLADAIYAANKSALPSPDALSIGQRLVLP